MAEVVSYLTTVSSASLPSRPPRRSELVGSDDGVEDDSELSHDRGEDELVWLALGSENLGEGWEAWIEGLGDSAAK